MRAFLFLLLPGCIAFNDVCPLDDSEVLGETLRSLDLREETLQVGEAGIGDLVADAMLLGTTGADVAIVPAAMFVRTTGCSDRDFLQRGLVRKADIDDLLPANDTVVLLAITTDDLRRIYERSVSALGLDPPRNPGFLQIAGSYFTADCAESPQSLIADGTAVLFPGARVDAASIFISNAPAAPGDSLKIAVPSSLLTGAYGYIDLTRPGALLLDTQMTLRDLVADYLRRNSPIEPQAQGRVLLKDSCR